ncbi:MAG: hypothetical protein HKN70_08845 [Gammaproteobacteria bacterium]|nr:hypothetical protein [Gammaproteobacteria bacterium]
MQPPRLKWLCRRGMRELDKLTEGYLLHHYGTANPIEQEAFAQLLELPDPELLALVLEQQPPPDDVTALVLTRMRTLNFS